MASRIARSHPRPYKGQGRPKVPRVIEEIKVHFKPGQMVVPRIRKNRLTYAWKSGRLITGTLTVIATYRLERIPDAPR